MSHKAKSCHTILRKSSSPIGSILWFIAFENFHYKLSNNVKSAWLDTSATNNELSPSNKPVVSIITVCGHLHLLTAKVISLLIFYVFRNHKTS